MELDKPLIQVIPFIGTPNPVSLVHCSWCGTAGAGSYGDRMPRLYDHDDAQHVAATHEVMHTAGLARNNTEG